jgi:hypothetical protein
MARPAAAGQRAAVVLHLLRLRGVSAPGRAFKGRVEESEATRSPHVPLPLLSPVFGR